MGSSLGRRIRYTFMAGLLVVIPIVVTTALTLWLFDRLTDLVPHLLSQLPFPVVHAMLEEPFGAFLVRLIGLVVLFAAVYVVGLVARNVVGRKLLQLLDAIILRLPMVRTIYSTVQQIGRAVLKGGGTGMFRQVALVEYPKAGTYAVAFVTASAADECIEKTGTPLTSLFVPTTPNPTSGFLLLVPEHEVIVLDMTVAEGMRLVISGGVVKPGVTTTDTVDGMTAETAAAQPPTRDNAVAP